MTMPKDLMEGDMERMPFVNWDRLTINEKDQEVDLYGWIEREQDSYKDFVLLNYKHDGDNKWTTSFNTSSEKYTRDIFKILGCIGTHNDCERVEKYFRINNVIRLVHDERGWENER